MENLVQIVVVVLMAVQETYDVRLCPEENIPVDPVEGKHVSARSP